MIKIGQIVPSSNLTMEREIPAIFRAREQVSPERFSFHSSRMRMKKVTKEELEAMDADSDRCALELSDAKVDVLGYACLVAIMSMGHGYHRVSQARLRERTRENDGDAPVVTSAGALVEGLEALGAKKIAVIAPYMQPLTKMVVDYIEHEGVTVQDYIALEIPDNLAVGARDPLALLDIYPRPGHAYIGSAVFGLHMPVWSVVIALLILFAYALKLAVIGGDQHLRDHAAKSFPPI